MDATRLRLNKHLANALSSALVLSVVLLDQESVWLTFANVPPMAVVVVSLLVLFLINERSLVLPSLFLVAGALTLPFSLAPGHTLVAILWELTYVAAAAALVPRWARFALLGVLTWHGLTHIGSLALWGIVGPTLVGYGYGGIAAGLVFPSVVVTARIAADASRPRFVRLALAIGGVVVVSGAVFVALASGSRAIYLALACALILFLVRGWKTAELRSGSLVLVGATALALTLDGMLPASPIMQVLPERASAEIQTQDLGSSVGNVRWRLAMWHQSLMVLSDYPFGTGAGSFSSVIHAFQRYPMLWSTSAHNYLVETLMTGGLLRLGILSTLVAWSLLRAMRSQNDWAWAPAIVALWIPLLFDVAGSNPVYMAVAFGVTGTASAGAVVRTRWLTLVALVVGLSAALWWYVPCQGTSCAIDRFRAFTPAVDAVLRTIDDDQERQSLVRRALRLYPKTAKWHSIELRDSGGNPEAWSSFVARFPFVSPEYFVLAATSLAEAGACDQARSTATEGLSLYGQYENLYGQARLSRERHNEIVQALSAFEAPCPRGLP